MIKNALFSSPLMNDITRATERAANGQRPHEMTNIMQTNDAK
jgi:hypothetical protein